jgi:hypothetical protein
MQLQTLVAEFTNQIIAVIEAQVTARVRTAMDAAFGTNGHSLRQERRPKLLTTPQRPATGRTRKKAPRQLCPVPGCKNTAAPVFGMVCAQHKNVAKSKIKKYREARRKAKAAA